MWKKIIIGVLVFAVLFTGTAFITNYISYMGFQGVSVEMENPTLPVVYVKYNEQRINRMLAYNYLLDTSLLRDIVTPLSDDERIDIVIVGNDDYRNGVEYELRSKDGSNLIESGEFVFQGKSDEGKEYSASLRTAIQNDEEYLLSIKLSKSTEDNIRFYTRIKQVERNNLDDFLGYISEFRDKTFVKFYEDGSTNDKTVSNAYGIDINALLDARDKKIEKNSNNLGLVTLDATYDVISWGQLNPMIVSEIVPRVKEISDDSAIIETRYLVTSGTFGETTDYAVTELYNIEFNAAQGKYKLNGFTRKMSSIFEADNISADNNSIVPGITYSDEINYRTSSDFRKVGIEIEGQLWYYDYYETTMTNVYGCWRDDSYDIREIDNDYGIAIIDVTDDGIMHFAVYGRIGSGKHEGDNGIVLYEYNKATLEIVEMAFIRSDIPYNVLKNQVGQFAYYEAETADLYLLVNNAVNRININTYDIENVTGTLPANNVFISNDKKLIAFPETGDAKNVHKITIKNFETDNEYVKENDSKVLQIIGYVEDDVIIGEASPSNVTVATNGNIHCFFDKIYIIDENGDNIKTYDKSNVYISDINIQEGKIFLERTMLGDAGLMYEISQDYIVYKKDLDKSYIVQKNVGSEKELSQRHLVFPSNIYIRSTPSGLMTKTKSGDIKNRIEIWSEKDEKAWYVYSESGIEGTFYATGDAINKARDVKGFVIDSLGRMVYKDKENAGYNTIAGTFEYVTCSNVDDSFWACCYMSLLSDGINADINIVRNATSWENAFDEYPDLRGINISGVDINTALGFLSDSIPFAVKIDEGYVLVISYNSTHIRYYDPILGEEVKVGKNDFIKNMQRNNNEIYTYIKY